VRQISPIQDEIRRTGVCTRDVQKVKQQLARTQVGTALGRYRGEVTARLRRWRLGNSGFIEDMRLSREKIVRISHQITDVLVASNDVEFVDDRTPSASKSS